MAELILRAPDGAATTLPLTGDRMRLGRAADCELVVAGEGVSRHHARIRREGTRVTLEDLGSTYGTFVNDRAVHESELRDGDRIRLGPTVTLEFHDRAAAAAVAPKPPRPTRAPAHSPAPAPALPPAPGARRPARPAPWRTQRAELRDAWSGAALPIRHAATVGSDPACAIVLQDPEVEPLHARFDSSGGRLVVADLKSARGTFVNGERVMRADLADGDRLAFAGREYTVRLVSGIAWSRIAAALAAIATVAFAAWKLASPPPAPPPRPVSQVVVATLQQAIDEHRAGHYDLALSQLRYAADLMTLEPGDAPGAWNADPNRVFGRFLRELPAVYRGFDFRAVQDSATAVAAREAERSLTDSAYVYREIQRAAVEVGQSPDVPLGFSDKVWRYVQAKRRERASFATALRRSAAIQPTVRAILEEARLPALFAYIPWVESGLNPQAASAVGAVGLWQLMPGTARGKHLVVQPGRDERTDVVLSTRAAVSHISDLVLVFGREQFMCALASYNDGDGNLRIALRKIPKPLTMMPSREKYWYLVEHGLLPRETSEYVPQIFAMKILAESPARFGFGS